MIRWLISCLRPTRTLDVVDPDGRSFGSVLRTTGYEVNGRYPTAAPRATARPMTDEEKAKDQVREIGRCA